MGYCANGSGFISLKPGTNVEDIIAKICDTFDVYVYDDGIEFWSDDKYYEEDVLKTLKNIAPFIEEGYISYCGDDDLYWRFEFNSETGIWDELNGSIIFLKDDDRKLLTEILTLYPDKKKANKLADRLCVRLK